MSTPTRNEIQQLKSIRDDLCNKFRENDKLFQGLGTPLMALQNKATTNARRRLKPRLDKLTRQITALNLVIKHFET